MNYSKFKKINSLISLVFYYLNDFKKDLKSIENDIFIGFFKKVHFP